MYYKYQVYVLQTAVKLTNVVSNTHKNTFLYDKIGKSLLCITNKVRTFAPAEDIRQR